MDVSTISYQDRYVVYHPLKRLVFLANAALVNCVVKTQRDPPLKALQTPSNNDLMTFPETSGFGEPDPQFTPIVTSTVLKPTIVISFLTTVSNFCRISCAGGGRTTSR